MINICVTVNSKYLRYLYVMLVSLYKNHNKGDISLYVLQRDFTPQDKDRVLELSNKYGNKVEFIFVDPDIFTGYPVYIGGRTNLSLEIYFRLLIPDLLPEYINRLLMLDVDIVVNKNLSELYNISFAKGEYLAAAPNMCHNYVVKDSWRKWYSAGRRNWTHYNTGILLWNLEEMRNELPPKYLFDCGYQFKIETPTFEEEVFNVAFGDNRIHEIPAEKWNYIVTELETFKNPQFPIYRDKETVKEKCSIVHYAGCNPWQAGAKNNLYDIWWEIAKETPFYEDILGESYIAAEKMVSKQEKILSYIERMTYKECRSNIVDYLITNRYRNLVIYGNGRIARLLTMIVEDTDLCVLGYADKTYRGDFCGRPTVVANEIDEAFPNADCVIVSLGYIYDEVLSEIRSQVITKIISIDELLEVR